MTQEAALSRMKDAILRAYDLPLFIETLDEVVYYLNEALRYGTYILTDEELS